MIELCSGQTVKLSVKTKEALHQNPLNVRKNPDVRNLIFYLTDLLNSWDAKKVSNDLQSDQPDSLYKKDLIVLLATKIDSVNARDDNQFVYTTQLYIKEPETYAQAMQKPNTTQWAKAIEEELDQLYKNKRWKLIPTSKMKPDH